MKLKILIGCLIILSASGSAVGFSVKDSCDSDEQPLFSIYSKNGGNAGMPGFYDTQVCATSVSEADFYQNCPNDLNNILSFYKKNDTHVSTFKSYKWDLCASEFKVSVNKSCSDSNSIVSLKYKDDTHVAEPGYYDQQLCAASKVPENVTVQMSTGSTTTFYVDGEEAEERSYSPIEVSYPYVVSDQPIGIVSLGELLSIEYEEESSKNIARMTQSRGSFLLPFTRGGYTEVEEEEELITNREFLSKFEPRFGFQSLETPNLRIDLDPNVEIKGFEDRLSGNIRIYTRNRYSNESVVEIKPVE